MFLLAHDTLDDVKASAVALNALGPAARRLLAECVETSGVTRQAFSTAAKNLETAGFLFVRNTSTLWTEGFDLSPTLAGEEALAYLEDFPLVTVRTRKSVAPICPIPM